MAFKNLAAITPIGNPSLSPDGVLRFANIAEEMDMAPRPVGYETVWYAFDNISGTSSPLGHVRAIRPAVAAPTALPSAPSGFVRVDVSAIDSATAERRTPVRASFRRDVDFWRLVGLDRGIPAATVK